MRVLIVNTSEKTGGAAVAANRLMAALNNNGVKAKMLVRDKQTDDITVVGLQHKRQARWHFLWERWCVFWHLRFSKQHLFEIDIANSGFDITHLREFREADVIHLSWINQGMLSLKNIGRIVASGKPVVWTMHDLWPATGICHYAQGCTRYYGECRQCKLLPGGGGTTDLSTRVFRRKRALWQKSNIFFVSCSRWLEGQARHSSLLTGLHMESIPNPINTRVFAPQDKGLCRQALHLPADKRIILFVSQRVTDARKGMDYLVEAVDVLVKEHPNMLQDTVIALLGGHSEDLAGRLRLPVYSLGYVSEERTIVQVYGAADVFVLPSLEDNLPNTIMEAMACGVPCVGFKVGGIPEEIDHLQNGYVAAYRDAADLARGLHWVLYETDHETLSKQAVQKVVQNYSEHSVAMRYIEVYHQAMAFKKYRL